MEEILFCPRPEFLNNQLFCEKIPNLTREYIHYPFLLLKQELAKAGYDAKTIGPSSDIQGAKAVFFVDMPEPGNSHYQKCLSAGMRGKMHLMLYEPPATRPDNYVAANHANFSKVLTWQDDLVDGKKYFKNNFVMPYLESEKIAIQNAPFGSKENLLCLVSANKYSTHPDQLYTERVRAIHFMEKNHPAEFDLYGERWDLPVIHSNLAERLMLNNMPKALHKLDLELRKHKLSSPTKLFPKWLYPSYKGQVPVGSKCKVMSGYKFSICYENQKNIPGYVSEKIMDSMLAGCVPVYLGASNIEEHVPKECFVDFRNFAGYKELYGYLVSVDEAEYGRYLESMGKFLNSKKSREYKADFLVESVKSALP